MGKVEGTTVTGTDTTDPTRVYGREVRVDLLTSSFSVLLCSRKRRSRGSLLPRLDQWTPPSLSGA